MNGLRTLLTASASAAVMIFAPMAQAETLTDALIAAYKNSHLLDQNRALLRAADEDVASAVAALRPVVAFSLGTTYLNTEDRLAGVEFTTDGLINTTAELTWTMSLYDFGRGAAAVANTKEVVLATRARLVDFEQQVLSATVQAYVDVRRTAEIVSLRKNNVELIGQELKAAGDRFDVGEITRTDVALAESRLASARAAQAAADGDYVVAREAYKAVTGKYPGNLAVPPKAPKIPGSLTEAQKIALRTHPTLTQVQHQVAAADFVVARAEANLRPTLNGQASVGVAPGGVESESVTLQLKQTLYAGGGLSADYRQAVANREAQRANLHQVAVNVEQNVGRAWANLDVANASIIANNRQIEAAQVAFDGLREEAKLGARTTLDVLNAEQELLNARASKATSEATRYAGVYSVLQSMGLLTVEHLQLGIPTYDVTGYYNAVKDAPLGGSAQSKSLDRIMKSIGQGN